MGIFKDLVTSQLIDVIEWTDDSQNTMVYKYDMNGKEIMMGAQLTVRESQAASTRASWPTCSSPAVMS